MIMPYLIDLYFCVIGKWVWICFCFSSALWKYLQVFPLCSMHVPNVFVVLLYKQKPWNNLFLKDWFANFRIPESLPILHDKVLAAAAEATVSLSPSQKKTQVVCYVSGFQLSMFMNNSECFFNFCTNRFLLLGF